MDGRDFLEKFNELSQGRAVISTGASHSILIQTLGYAKFWDMSGPKRETYAAQVASGQVVTFRIVSAHRLYAEAGDARYGRKCPSYYLRRDWSFDAQGSEIQGRRRCAIVCGSLWTIH